MYSENAQHSLLQRSSLHLMFEGLAIVSIGYNNVVLIKLIADIFKWGNITKMGREAFRQAHVL